MCHVVELFGSDELLLTGYRPGRRKGGGLRSTHSTDDQKREFELTNVFSACDQQLGRKRHLTFAECCEYQFDLYELCWQSYILYKLNRERLK